MYHADGSFVVQSIRETSRIGIAPRRKGSEFNRKEFDMAVLDKMVEMVEPDRPRNFQGSFLSERQAIDANKAMLFDSHPEMMVCSIPPAPPSTAAIAPQCKTCCSKHVFVLRCVCLKICMLALDANAVSGFTSMRVAAAAICSTCTASLLAISLHRLS